jgi:hypothetical protein
MTDETPLDRWLDPLLIDCPCRHCSRGRMCKRMADLYRRAVRRDAELIRDLDRRLEMAELKLPPADQSWLKVEET